MTVSTVNREKNMPVCQGFPLEFYFRGHKSPLTLIKGDISGDLGDNHMTLNRKIPNFRGHYVSHERKFRGHLKKSRAKSPFFEGQGKPCCMLFTSHNIKFNA